MVKKISRYKKAASVGRKSVRKHAASKQVSTKRLLIFIHHHRLVTSLLILLFLVGGIVYIRQGDKNKETTNNMRGLNENQTREAPPETEEVISKRQAAIDTSDYRKHKMNFRDLMPDTEALLFIDGVITDRFTVKSDGSLSFTINFPADSPAGFYEIELSAVHKSGHEVTYDDSAILGYLPDDFDGDGVKDAHDSCPTIFNAGIDEDGDDIDDACDIET